MTPKEKAEAIIRKTVSLVNDWNADWANGKTIEEIKKDRSHRWWNSKRVAENTINEVIEQWTYIDTYLADLNGELNPNLKYWLDVKTELSLL